MNGRASEALQNTLDYKTGTRVQQLKTETKVTEPDGPRTASHAIISDLLLPTVEPRIVTLILRK